MPISEIIRPPLPDRLEDCRGRGQKRRWCAHQALRYLTEARAHVEIAELRGDPDGLAMTIASGLVSKAQAALSQFDGQLAAGYILLKWQPLAELKEPTAAYFAKHTAVLDRAIRRLHINCLSPSELFWTVLFGPPVPPPS